MATLQVQKPIPLCPTGPHLFTLIEVKPAFSDKFQSDQLMWRFASDKMSPEGTLYEVAIWTGLKYGNSKAKLTWLLDMLQPGITPAQIENLDTDVFLHQRYEGMVKHAAKESGDGQYATFLYLRPLQTAQAAVVTHEEAPDPFAFDDADVFKPVQVCAECGVEVDANMAAKAIKRFGVILCHPHGRARMAADRADKPATGAPVAA